MISAPFTVLDKLYQPLRIVWRGAFLIVVELHEHLPTLAPPSPDAPRPIAQRLVWIIIFVATSGAMPAYVDVTCRRHPRCGRLMMIREA